MVLEEKSGDEESRADAKLMQKLQTPQNPNKRIERAKGIESLIYGNIIPDS